MPGLEKKRFKSFPSGKCIRKPISFMTPQVDASFLGTQEGVFLRSFAKELIKNDLVTEKSVTSFFKRINKELQIGSCCGQSQTFSLFRRTLTTDRLKEWTPEEIAHAIFLQVCHEVPLYLEDDLQSRATTYIVKLRKTREKRAKLSKKIKAIRQKIKAAHYVPKNIKKKRTKTVRKVKIGELQRRLKKFFSQRKILYVKATKTKNELQKVRKKRARIKGFCSSLHHEAKTRWAEKGLLVSQDITFSRGKKSQSQFSATIAATLTKFFSHKKSSDFHLSISEDHRPETDHMFVVQPHQLRLYDPEKGELLFKDIPHIIRDIEEYCTYHKVNKIQIEEIISESIPN